MKTYRITVPAFSLTIDAKDEKEALETFDWEYDNAQSSDSEFGQPIVKEIIK